MHVQFLVIARDREGHRVREVAKKFLLACNLFVCLSTVP